VTDTRANSYLDGQGNLVIQALAPAAGQYTSARLKTLGNFSVKYGRVEARMRIPHGQGIWPGRKQLSDRHSGLTALRRQMGLQPSLLCNSQRGGWRIVAG